MALLSVVAQWRWTPGASAAERVAYIAVPHPDDEFQVWSLVEDTPEDYKVFITMTHGEATTYCEPAGYARSYQPGLERPADPAPTGRWTSSCSRARLGSHVRYFRDMAAADDSVPGALTDLGTKGPFPADGVGLCRTDASTSCTDAQRTARVWRDAHGRGALVVFDLGDGDLTSAEVAWAIRTVRDHRGALGLDTSLPDSHLLGTYANADPACFLYPNADHEAVHTALSTTDFGLGHQSAATCAADPDADRSAVVSAAGADAAFRLSGQRRVGAHVSNYGWLEDPHYALDRTGQSQLFHTHQHFWSRGR